MEHVRSPHLHLHLSGHASPEWVVVALIAALVALLVVLLRPDALPRADLAWPYTALQQAGRSTHGLAPVYNPREARLRFTVGGYRGGDLFAAGMPTSLAVDCETGATEAGTGPARAFGRLGFDPSSGVYTYRWVIDAAWLGTCRRLDLRFADGSSHPVLLRFEDPERRPRNGRCGLPFVSTAGSVMTSAAAPDRERSC